MYTSTGDRTDRAVPIQFHYLEVAEITRVNPKSVLLQVIEDGRNRPVTLPTGQIELHDVEGEIMLKIKTWLYNDRQLHHAQTVPAVRGRYILYYGQWMLDPSEYAK